jgi:hypothetical protein
MTPKANKILKDTIRKLRAENVAELSKPDADNDAVLDNRRIIRNLYTEVMEDEFNREEAEHKTTQKIGYKNHSNE